MQLRIIHNSWRFSAPGLVSIYLFLCLWSFYSCGEPAKFGNEEQNLVKAEVRLMFDDCYADIRRDGLLAELKYLDNSTSFFWVAPGYHSILSYDSVKSIMKSNAGVFKSIDQHWDTLAINPFSKDLASYTGSISSVTTDTTGKIMHAKLLETGIVIRRNNGWKLLCGQTSQVSE